MPGARCQVSLECEKSRLWSLGLGFACAGVAVAEAQGQFRNSGRGTSVVGSLETATEQWQ
jgi:hypothetical protein